MMLKLYYLVLWINQVMNEIINKIKDAVYRIKIESKIDPYSYQQGLIAGRQQAIDMICEADGHIYEGIPNGTRCIRCSWLEVDNSSWS